MNNINQYKKGGTFREVGFGFGPNYMTNTNGHIRNRRLVPVAKPAPSENNAESNESGYFSSLLNNTKDSIQQRRNPEPIQAYTPNFSLPEYNTASSQLNPLKRSEIADFDYNKIIKRDRQIAEQRRRDELAKQQAVAAQMNEREDRINNIVNRYDGFYNIYDDASGKDIIVPAMKGDSYAKYGGIENMLRQRAAMGDTLMLGYDDMFDFIHKYKDMSRMKERNDYTPFVKNRQTPFSYGGKVNRYEGGSNIERYGIPRGNYYDNTYDMIREWYKLR